MARWVGRGRFRPLPPVADKATEDRMNRIARRALLVVAAVAAVLSATGCAAERLDPNDSAQLSPAFNGDDVVWEDSRNDESTGTDLYRWNVSTATESPVVV